MLLLAFLYECPELFQLDFDEITFFRYKGAEDEIAGCELSYRMDQASYNAFLDQEDDISTDWLYHYSGDDVTHLGGSVYQQPAYRTIVYVPEFG